MRRRLESLLPLLVLVGFARGRRARQPAAHQRRGARRRRARGLDRRRGAGHRRQPGPALPQHVRGHGRACRTRSRPVPSWWRAARPTWPSSRSCSSWSPTPAPASTCSTPRARSPKACSCSRTPIGEPFEWPGLRRAGASADLRPGRSAACCPCPRGSPPRSRCSPSCFPILDPATGAAPGRVRVRERGGRRQRLQQGDRLAPARRDRRVPLLRRARRRWSRRTTPPCSAAGSPTSGSSTDPAGVHRFDGRLVVLAEVPAAGWRVAFRQDIDEFEQPAGRPARVRRARARRGAPRGRVPCSPSLLTAGCEPPAPSRSASAALSEAQQELISIVSHELRTPVAGVLGFLETTLDHWDAMDDAERRSAVSRAAANARRLQAMTRDVLDTQSVEAGRLVHVLEPLDLAAEVRVAVEAARALAPDRTFEVRTPDEPVLGRGRRRPPPPGARQPARQRPEELAGRRADRGRAWTPDERGEVCVRDHGAGIAEESLERIFDKFVRERGDTVSGTGLGLYIARQMIDAHGGRIWAESEAGSRAPRSTSRSRSAPGRRPSGEPLATPSERPGSPSIIGR